MRSANAGMSTTAAQLTEDGYEVHMQTNHLSHFLLSSLLMPALERAAKTHGSARVVNHSSASRKNPKATPLRPESLQKAPMLKKPGVLAGLNRYQQSKLANMLFTAALQVCNLFTCNVPIGADRMSVRKCAVAEVHVWQT
jgi:NAD(P)-dependent dehydrogenase (short-subunit alcohol dehydrogenase family)